MPSNTFAHSSSNKNAKQGTQEQKKQKVFESQTPLSTIIQQARIDPKSLTPSHVLRLQRTIGNRAVGQLLNGANGQQSIQSEGSRVDVSHHPSFGAIQRMIPARDNSDEKLKGIYDELVLRSLMLRILGEMVGKPRKVYLTFATDKDLNGRDAAYLVEKHQIMINEKHRGSDPSVIKRWILIELNHMREIVHKSPDNSKIELPKEQTEDENNDLFNALEALRVEYHEWISAYLTHAQIQNINRYTKESKAKPEEDEEISPRYAKAYEKPGEGWYLFENYLEDQRGTHTRAYDPKAGENDWVGRQLFDQAQENSGQAAFKIQDISRLNTSDLKGFEDSYIIKTDPYHNLLRRENPFKGDPAQELINDYAEMQQDDATSLPLTTDKE